LSTISVVFLTTLAPEGEASAAIGGPDAFGYSFVDQVDGAPYLYIDITATGMNLASGDDILVAATNLGATFNFYGEAITQVRPSTNGFITSTLGTSSNFLNTCPLPAAQTGGGFRIAPLHDDLISTVYYQYFDEAGAEALGIPGQQNGISVFQWVGEYFPLGGGDSVDFEVILFHDLDFVLTMVAADTNGGSGATLGIQDATAAIALQYSCNMAGATIPGATAVLYYLQLTTDSDCCTLSINDTPGCLDAGCQASVCAADVFCCTDVWDGICAEEAAELCALCTVCGDGFVGVGEECDGDGDGVPGETATCDADCTAVACGDGSLNVTAGETCDDGGESAMCDSDCTAVECGDSLVNTTAGETCDDGGRSATCNADCTAVSCGDGVLNVTAGEECDDAGESAACDADCTNAMCGDMTMNAAAGEECDDGGESMTCDDDCTTASCGDGVMNATAGEECDDGNTDDGDGCAADCTTEGMATTTGESTSGESTGGESTAGPDTGVDDTAGSSGVEPTTGPGPVTLSAGSESSGGEETDTDTAGTVPPEEGCNCSTDGPATGRGAVWSVLALFGLGALRRRRRRA
jgi:MYXO-CTERM domain-containing protein